MGLSERYDAILSWNWNWTENYMTADTYVNQKCVCMGYWPMTPKWRFVSWKHGANLHIICPFTIIIITLIIITTTTTTTTITTTTSITSATIVITALAVVIKHKFSISWWHPCYTIKPQWFWVWLKKKKKKKKPVLVSTYKVSAIQCTGWMTTCESWTNIYNYNFIQVWAPILVLPYQNLI